MTQLKTVGPFTMDERGRTLSFTASNGTTKKVLLQPKQFQVFSYLADRIDIEVPYQETSELFWPDSPVENVNLSNIIYEIRTYLKIAEAGKERHLICLWRKYAKLSSTPLPASAFVKTRRKVAV